MLLKNVHINKKYSFKYISVFIIVKYVKSISHVNIHLLNWVLCLTAFILGMCLAWNVFGLF
jgi:hypothetical protein